MEIQLPSPVPEFNFDSTCSSPYLTAPSSPQLFGSYFCTAPTTPSRSRNFLRKDIDDNNSEGFEFEFSGDFERISLSADELFHGGKIRPLRPPLSHGKNSVFPPRSPRSRISQGKKLFQEALRKNHDPVVDPLTAANRDTRKGSEKINPEEQKQRHQRGREKSAKSSSPEIFNSKRTRSLSPLRITDIAHEEEEIEDRDNSQSKKSTIFSVFSFKTYRKWRLKDFLLFRSASEGRASTSKDPWMKYTALEKKTEDVKNLSFRSTDSAGSVSMRRGPVSAHEVHYKVNRAVTEEMKKKTFLPYKRGLMGCLGFHPGMHEISRGIGSLTRG